MGRHVRHVGLVRLVHVSLWIKDIAEQKCTCANILYGGRLDNHEDLEMLYVECHNVNTFFLNILVDACICVVCCLSL